jgi:Na+/phosphate symporter
VEVREQLFAQKLAAAVLALPTSILRLLDTRLASLREDFITKHTAIGSPNISKTQKAAEMRRFKRVSDEYHEAVKMYNLYLERDNASKEEQKRRPQAVWEECKNVDYMGDFPWTAGTQSDGNVPHAVRQHASKLLMKSNRLKEEFVLLGAEVKDAKAVLDYIIERMQTELEKRRAVIYSRDRACLLQSELKLFTNLREEWQRAFGHWQIFADDDASDSDADSSDDESDDDA